MTTRPTAAPRALMVLRAIILLVAATALIGWITHTDRLARVTPSGPMMRVNTALAFLVVALTVAGGTDRRRVIGGTAIGLVGLTSVLEYLGHWSFGIDQLLFRDPTVGPAPGRMAPATAVCFVLLGFALCSTTRGGHLADRVRSITACAVLVIAGTGIISFAFGSAPVLRFGPWVEMALSTAVLFVLAAIAVLLSSRGVPLALRNSVAGVMLRRTLAALVILPFSAGVLVLAGENANWYDDRFTMALMTTATTALLAAVVWRTASAAENADRARSAAADELRALEHEHALTKARGASDERFRLSVDKLPEAVSVHTAVRDAAGTIVDFRWKYANAASAALTGYERSDLEGRTLLDVLPDHGPSGMFETYRQVVETGDEYVEPTLWYTDVWGDGRMRRRAFDMRANKLDDGFVVVFREVTEERQAEYALRESEERFRLIFDTAPIGELLVGLDGTIQQANPALCRLIGCGPDELVGQDLRVLTHADDIEKDDLQKRRLVAGEIDRYQIEMRYLRTNGDAVWGLVGVSLLRDAAGAPLSLIRQVQDITAERANDEELRRANAEITYLSELGELLQACATADEAFAAVGQSAELLFPDRGGALSILVPSHDILEPVASWGGGPKGWQRFAPEGCWALRLGRSHVSRPTGPRCDHLAVTGITTCLCVPLMSRDETLGVFHLTHRHDASTTDASAFDESTRRLANTTGERVAVAIANLQLRDMLRTLSVRDPLTGLFNRRYMEETFARELSRAERQRTVVGVMQIDIDGFKAFNDSYGHEAGDAVLESVAKLFSEFFRSSDVVCRYGGEEFTVILPDSSREATKGRAQELRTRLRDVVVHFDHATLTVPTISCGVAAYPDDGTTTTTLLRAADLALYAAKHAGRDCVMTADPRDEGPSGLLAPQARPLTQLSS